jgi:transmembrane sensor
MTLPDHPTVNSSTSTTSKALDAQALDWFVRAQGGLSAEEEGQLQQWRSARPAHQQAYARWQTPWQQLEQLPADGLARLRHRLQADLAREQAPRPSASGIWRRWLALPTAALTLGCTAYLGWWHWMQQPTFEAHYATTRGVQQQMTLPDGSQLRLDTLTRLDASLYRQRREVRLQEGQAQFNVAHDASQPFTVRAGQVRVTVVGTRFSVRYTPQTTGDDHVQVAVQEGLVRVEPDRDGQADAPLHAAATGTTGTSVLLHAGEQVLAAQDGLLQTLPTLSVGSTPAWLHYRVTLDNTPLSAALAEFERYGPTRLQLANADVGLLRVTGSFDARHLGNFLRALPQVLPVRVVALDTAQTQAADTAPRWRIEAR